MKLIFWAAMACSYALSHSLAEDKPAEIVKSAPAPQIVKTNQSSLPTLCTLETRGRVIEIKAGQKYKIKTKAGKVLAENISIEKLQASYPDLHKMLTTGMAQTGAVMDARVKSRAVIDGRR